MKKVLKSHRGITIMALVITIIVLLILASVSIKIAIDGGLISVTQNAKDDNTIDSEKEAISLGYNAYKRIKERYKYFDGETSEQKNAVLEVEDAEEVTEDGEDWIISFKTKNEYRLKADGDVIQTKRNGKDVEIWKENNDGTITDGKTTLKVGDYVNYDATKDKNGNSIETTTYISNGQKFDLNSYTGGWRVLGVVGGQLRLISADIIGPDSGGKVEGDNKYYNLRGKTGYESGKKELNAISKFYAQGKGATDGRSIKAEDINEITGYDPMKTGDGKPAKSGDMSEYGIEITYYWDGTAYPYYIYKIGANKKTGKLTIEHNTFNYFNLYWTAEEKPTKATSTYLRYIISLTNSSYDYYPTTLTEKSTGEVKGIEKESNEWKLLFENTGAGKWYWLATTNISNYSTSAAFQISCVSSEKVSSGPYFYSTDGQASGGAYGVRPIIFMDSGIQIKKNSQYDGSTLEKACKIK